MQLLITAETSLGLWSTHQQSAVVSHKQSALLEDHSSRGEEVLVSESAVLLTRRGQRRRALSYYGTGIVDGSHLYRYDALV